MAQISPREAFHIAVKHTLQNLIDERRAVIIGNLDEIVAQMIDTFEFAEDFEQMLEEHLIIFGENYGI